MICKYAYNINDSPDDATAMATAMATALVTGQQGQPETGIVWRPGAVLC